MLRREGRGPFPPVPSPFSSSVSVLIPSGQCGTESPGMLAEMRIPEPYSPEILIQGTEHLRVAPGSAWYSFPGDSAAGGWSGGNALRGRDVKANQLCQSPEDTKI